MDSLNRRLDFAVINTGAVKRDKRHAVTVFNVMNQDIVDPSLHVHILGTEVTGCHWGQASRPEVSRVWRDREP